jgi:uncharacterized protein YsxB (DUF464 family)
MIRVRLSVRDGALRQLEISGHADSAPHGQDLVCAGVSCIAYGLLNALDQMVPDACRITVEPNRIRIEVLQDSAELQTILTTARWQLATVAQRYPQYVSLNMTEG